MVPGATSFDKEFNFDSFQLALIEMDPCLWCCTFKNHLNRDIIYI